MFYTQLFTSKRGPLAKIWLAAHWERKLTKAHVFECNLETTIKDIISPQIKIGLRTSGHLLLGVVRIYSRKAKYLLADCSDAVVKIRVAFRPGQMDLPEESTEAMFKAITLPEHFTDFESQLPDPNTIDVVDHFTLNQCRSEDITLKEDFGNGFMSFESFGDDTRSHQGGLFDVSFHSFGPHGDAFGDEGTGFNLLDLMSSSEEAMPSDLQDSLNEMPATPPPTAINEAAPASVDPDPSSPEALVEALTLNETTLLENNEEGFCLEPVTMTPSLERKRKRKRRLVVDQTKELSNQAIRSQLSDSSDLLTALDMAPPTRQLMEWKETGGVDRLFHCLSTPIIHPDLQQLLPRDAFPRRPGTDAAGEESGTEEMRGQWRDEEGEPSVLPVEELSVLPVEELSVLQQFVDPDRTGSVVEPEGCVGLPEQEHWDTANEENRLEISFPELPSEDSMLVHPSGVERGTPITETQTPSVLDSQDAEERRMTSRAQNLLQALKWQSSSPSAMFSLHALCERGSRSQAAATFFCLLVLKKQRALDLHQSEPYADVIATPGPRFHLHQSQPYADVIATPGPRCHLHQSQPYADVIATPGPRCHLHQSQPYADVIATPGPRCHLHQSQPYADVIATPGPC